MKTGKLRKLLALLLALTLCMSMVNMTAFAQEADTTIVSSDENNTSNEENNTSDVNDNTGDNTSDIDENAGGVDDVVAPSEGEEDVITPLEEEITPPEEVIIPPTEEEPVDLEPAIELFADETSEGTFTVDGTSYGTMAEAMSAVTSTENTVTVNGDFTTGLTFTKKVNVVIETDVTITGEGAGKGIAFNAGGSTLTCEDDATLTITNFDLGLCTSNVTIGDGTYYLNDHNMGFGAYSGQYENWGGTFKGTDFSGIANDGTLKTTLNVYADNCNRVQIPGATYENCTIVATCNGYTTQGGGFTATNSIIHTTGLSYYIVSAMALDNSTFWADGTDYSYTTGIAFSECGGYDATITNNSLLKATNWIEDINSKGITVTYRTLTIDDGSVVWVDNNGRGGFNINSGNTIFDNARLIATRHDKGHFVAQTRGSITITNSSVFDLDLSGIAVGGGQSGTNYIILGGSVPYQEFEQTEYKNMAIPVNGAAHGNEKLHMFALSEEKFDGDYSLTMVDMYDETYEYLVENASSDGYRYVWGPAATITFDLSNVEASFADGQTTPKDLFTLHGYSLAFVDAVAPIQDINGGGNSLVGWFYRDANGVEQPFGEDVVFGQDTTVYAKWSANSVTYHSNFDGDNEYAILYAEDQAAILSLEAILSQSSDFAQSGPTFLAWNTKADGSGTSYAPDNTLALDKDSNVHLYAQWQTYTVNFVTNRDDITIPAQTGIVYNTKSTDPALKPLGYGAPAWYTKSDFTGRWFFFTKVTSDMTLYAKWTETNYTISFRPYTIFGDNTTHSQQTVGYGYNATPMSPDPTYAGYEFGGWCTSSSGIGETFDFENTTITGSKIFYGKWIPSN